jgi:hypothetical protein|tara:strand:- start:231 stop:461 length:231 start_codon:yes stop_codon:yes gene_type:complete
VELQAPEVAVAVAVAVDTVEELLVVQELLWLDILFQNQQELQKQLVVLSVSMVVRPFMPSQVLELLLLLQIGQQQL